MSELPPLQESYNEEEEEDNHEELIRNLVEANKSLILDSKIEYVLERYYAEANDYIRDIIGFNPTIFRSYANKAWLNSIPYPYTSTSAFGRRNELLSFLTLNPSLCSCRPDLCRQRLVNVFGLKLPRMTSIKVDEGEPHPHTIAGIVSMNYSQEDLDEAANLE